MGIKSHRAIQKQLGTLPSGSIKKLVIWKLEQLVAQVGSQGHKVQGQTKADAGVVSLQLNPMLSLV